MAVIVVRRRDAPLVEWRPGVRSLLHARPGAGPAVLCLLEQWCDPGAGAPTHTHFETEEILVVVEGDAEVRVDGESAALAAGDSVVFPPHSWHGFSNRGAGTLHVLALFSAAEPLVRYRDEHARQVLRLTAGGGAIDPHRAVDEA
jgi:glyoxylate utilization-related uncharacterized protein